MWGGLVYFLLFSFLYSDSHKIYVKTKIIGFNMMEKGLDILDFTKSLTYTANKQRREFVSRDSL